LVENIIGEMPFPFPVILGSYLRVLGSIIFPSFCFTSFDIEHLGLSVDIDETFSLEGAIYNELVSRGYEVFMKN